MKCPECGSDKVYRAYIEDGGQGDWCPNCKKSLQKMDYTLISQIKEFESKDIIHVENKSYRPKGEGVKLKANKKIIEESACSICNKKFSFGEDIYTCSICGKFYHQKCWEDHGGCSQEGCHEEIKLCPFCEKEIKESAIKCRHCGQYLEETLRAKIFGKTLLKQSIVEVEYPDGETKDYDNLARLRADILAGKIKKSFPARSIQKKQDGAKQTTNVKWSTVEKIAKIHFDILSLYKPIWAYTRTGFLFGAIAGVIIKVVDTTILLFSIKPEVGFVWLLVIAIPFFSYLWRWAWVVVMIIVIKSGFGNLYMTSLVAMFIGVIFGGPIGMIAGTVTGHIKADNLLKAPDAINEGSSPYINGIVIPAMWLAIAIPLYLFYIIPKIMK